jgi:hypothetical protein
MIELPPRTKRRYFAEKMSRCIPKVPYRSSLPFTRPVRLPAAWSLSAPTPAASCETAGGRRFTTAGHDGRAVFGPRRASWSQPRLLMVYHAADARRSVFFAVSRLWPLVRALALLQLASGPTEAAWSYTQNAHEWLQLLSCQSSSLGPCVIPPPPDGSNLTQPTINLVKNEQFVVSWHVNEKNRPATSGATERAFVQLEKTACTTGLPGSACGSGDAGDTSGCSTTLAGRRNIFADQCSGLTTQGTCTGSGLPCVWDAKDAKCGQPSSS